MADKNSKLGRVYSQETNHQIQCRVLVKPCSTVSDTSQMSSSRWQVTFSELK